MIVPKWESLSVYQLCTVGTKVIRINVEPGIFFILGDCLGHVKTLGHKNYDFLSVFGGENVFENVAFLAEI